MALMIKRFGPISKHLSILALTTSSILFSGCGDSGNVDQPATQVGENSTPDTPKFPGTKIRVAALQDKPLGLVTADIVGEWQASREAEVEIIDSPDNSSQTGLDPSVDVWLIRGQSLGDLVDKGLLATLGDLNADWQKRPPVFENLVCRYGPDRYAVPIGTRSLVLVYREEQANSPDWQQAIKQSDISFPPKTWDEFDKFVGLLHQTSPDLLALPSKPEPDDHLALDIFMARATATGKHRDHFSFLFSAETMEPRIANVPFADSLKALSALRPKTELTPKSAREAFRNGKAGLLIDYAENAGQWANPEEKSKIAVSPLPGSIRVYEPDRKTYDKMQAVQLSGYLPNGGGYLAVMAKNRPPENSKAALDFLTYLVSEATAVQWAADRRMLMCPTRDAILAGGFVDPRIAPKVESGAWGDAILTQLTTDNPVAGLRIPEADSFLSDLETAVLAGINGKESGEVLKNAAESWSSRVQKFGVQRMRWHYRRSLIRPQTDPKPPPAGK